MALNDNAVLTAAVGYIYTAPVGTARPTAAELATIDPISFGAQVQTLKVENATGGTFTVKKEAADTPVVVAFDASAAAVQTALESLPSLGAGNVLVTGASLADGLSVAFVGQLQGKAFPALLTSSASLEGSGATASAVIAAAPNGWSMVGHTSRNDMPEFGFDGGNRETRGTWQNAKLREIETESPADYLTVKLQQVDTAAFELYYGKNDSTEPGVFGVSGDTGKVNERAFFVIIVDGEDKVGFYVPKASVSRDDGVDLPIDDFASFPIKATFLKHGSRNLYEWINEDWFPLAS
ncbi:hypothetical protein [Segniliparus rugosus]|uniref:Major tail protein n=1 Tax=Segniliparus rugosus (strain ATCC BAA-974 / DSM 45345 / CCUG 50838 / CIP 108380 / JCM 13579 / CDC 945) TaxID=679197 RepID=E5XRS8_SEGRC|nr:hypothetical protein [Segniliparus rugosus]EFV12943.1 hypothetical protein HMPREF9336_02200 [Segniliparus rugosus ATCC BAA-974]